MCLRATAAITRSAIRGGRTSGHLSTAWNVTPMAWAALPTDPPSILIASTFSIRVVNHSSGNFATMIPAEIGILETMVASNYGERLAEAMRDALEVIGVVVEFQTGGKV